MPRNQSGFTLVEIAIVLVIIGLLLGGVLKGQELINSAKVKNFATDFRNIPLFIYGYQDKFKALPGDDPSAVTHLGAGGAGTDATVQIALATGGGTAGNGVIDGFWDSFAVADESYVFWQHVRRANLAAGPTDTANATYAPTNADGGRIGIEAGVAGFISGLNGTYIVCSTGILGKFAKQLDTTMDNGDTETGTMRTVTTGHPRNTVAPAMNTLNDANSYTVCLAL
ncbi:MAG: prepilin-type N-terminal cleavage/methylation domain-containing protein [Candidatus Nitricoxidivorans perseverans]|uniref:Prepilin-type N-terminal cleavage/methylation domain-containing protein n=1 Tax=Candidatus Nitricoxidivorans perseverans TaxID=2975601 RepID=A0AA49FP41_9PROT|nr:MAG: prepilin-type N-terminal cleavage/methylation domain-containing protein [Candidatus Nitricoxidivorans perseverans]